MTIGINIPLAVFKFGTGMEESIYTGNSMQQHLAEI